MVANKKQIKEVKKAWKDGKIIPANAAAKENMKPHATDFTNNTLLDKVINDMAGEDKRMTADEIQPVYDKKFLEISQALEKAATEFDKKYAAHPLRKLLLDTIARAEKEDPDVSFGLTCVSKKVDELRTKQYALMALKLDKKITYPADTIDKINKL